MIAIPPRFGIVSAALAAIEKVPPLRIIEKLTPTAGNPPMDIEPDP